LVFLADVSLAFPLKLLSAAYGEIYLCDPLIGLKDMQFDPIFIWRINLIILINNVCASFFKDEGAIIRGGTSAGLPPPYKQGRAIGGDLGLKKYGLWELITVHRNAVWLHT